VASNCLMLMGGGGGGGSGEAGVAPRGGGHGNPPQPAEALGMLRANSLEWLRTICQKVACIIR
jgi:hypothetical protein